MTLFLSYFSGIVAAFTPCVIVLMPILLYRYFHENSKKDWLNFALFTISFLISYIIFGYFLSSLFTSSIQNGLRVGLGFLFIVLGLLSFMEKLNPINFPLFKSNIVLGIIFSFIISFNPCTIPFLSLIISLNSSVLIVYNMSFFALGIITPSILFAFFGNKVVQLSTKTGKIFNYVNKIMDFILILSGIYLVFSIKTIDKYDIILISIFILFIFYILLKVFFVLNSKKDLKNPGKLLLFFSLILILFTAFFHCNSNVGFENKILNILKNNSNFNYNYNSNIYTCNGDIRTCKVCKRCIFLFGISLLFGFLGIFLTKKIENNNF